MNRIYKILCAIAISLAVFGCASTPKPEIIAPLVVQHQERKLPNVPTIPPLSKFKPGKFTFKQPNDPSIIIGLDANSYLKLQEMMLGVNSRDKLWNNKLDKANKSILLLRGAKE